MVLDLRFVVSAEEFIEPQMAVNDGNTQRDSGFIIEGNDRPGVVSTLHHHLLYELNRGPNESRWSCATIATAPYPDAATGTH